MRVNLSGETDLEQLRQLVGSESGAKQRDRYRAVLLAAGGEGEGGAELEGDEIAARLGRSPRFVDQWLARYRGGGIEALRPRKSPGRPPRLAAGRRAEFKARFLGGPTAAADGGVCALRGLDAQRILKAEFGAEMKLSGVYELMRRLNLSLLKPRPRHPKNDQKQAEEWLGGAPLLRGS
jgi:transposase